METLSVKYKEIDKKWYLIDAKNQTLGRLSSKVAQILRGKNKVNFTPNLDMGDFVIVINVEKIKVSGKKSENKTYFKHSGFPGGASTVSYKTLKNKNPESILHRAIKGMLPSNRLGNKIIKNLKVYSGEKHPHNSQNPTLLEL